MKSFKLTNKEEEKEILEQQKKGTEINTQNKNFNFIQKNPQTIGAILIGFITYILIAINAGYIWVIPIIFGARRLLKAKKINENKNIIVVGYIIVYLPVLLWILSSIVFTINAINDV